MEAKECVDFLVEYLARKELAPHPHIRLIGPKPTWGTEPTSIWTVADKVKTNYVGYEFTCRKRDAEPRCITKFDFYVRIGPGSSNSDFERYSTEMALSLSTNECSLTVSTAHASQKYVIDPVISQGKSIFRKEIALCSNDIVSSEGKQAIQDIVLIFEKSWELLSDGSYRVQIKIINNSDGSTLYEPSYDSLTVMNALALDEDAVEGSGDGSDETEISSFTRLTLGALLEFNLSEELGHMEFEASAALKKRSPITRVFNLVSQSEESDRIEFADYLSVEEFIPKLKAGQGLAKFVKSLASHNLSLESEVVDAFSAVFSKHSTKPSFYAYQEEGIKSILKEIKERNNQPQLISIRTAGGKTELFLAPILDYCVKTSEKEGTKAMIFYPTKALANDQSRRLFDLLAELNKHLVASGKRAITMGIYHGGIESNRITWVPFKCSHCGSYLQAPDSSRSSFKCMSCEEPTSHDHALLTRNEIHRNPPDILITNPDVMNYVLADGGG
ncbi:MAG: hypothetical protein DRI61_13070, partial [Chloroflexi bacterium]